MINLMNWLGKNKEEYLENIKICNQRWDNIEDYIQPEEIKNLDPILWIAEAFNFKPSRGRWRELSEEWEKVVNENDEVCWDKEKFKVRVTQLFEKEIEVFANNEEDAIVEAEMDIIWDSVDIVDDGYEVI